MNILPIEHVAQGPWRKVSVVDACFHFDRDLELAVLGVEVSGFMVVVVHHDHDSQEPADYGHEPILPRPGLTIRAQRTLDRSGFGPLGRGFPRRAGENVRSLSWLAFTDRHSREPVSFRRFADQNRMRHPQKTCAAIQPYSQSPATQAWPVRVQRHEAARGADSGPLERGVRPLAWV